MSRQMISGRGGKDAGSSSSRSPVEAPNSLRSRATARVIDLVSEGPIVGLVDGLKSVFFDGTALQNDDGSFNFANVTVESRLGLPDQDPLPGFPAVETERSVGVEVLFDTPVVRTISNPDVDAVRVTIRIPALLSVNADTGDISATSVTVVIEAKPDGGSYTTLKTDTISGKTNSPYERSYRLTLPGAGPWDIRVSRTTADSESSALENKTFWSRFTEIIDHKLTYPDSAVFGVTTDAESFGGTIATRSYECDLLIIEVPSNYDAETRAYDGNWDGTFVSAWTDNPAWVFRDIIVNNRYGAGEFIDASQVDKWALYAIAQYCDEMVPDGFGGMEPRFTYNGILTSREEAIRVITALAGVFRGMAHWGAGAIYASADMPSDPVKLVTPANVVNGEFNYEGASLAARHTAALVTWSNPAIGYEPDIEVVEDAESIERFGYRPLEVTAVGCTSRGQAARFGKWALDTEKHESEIVNYQASFDHADLAPGDIIAIADPSYAGFRMGGRVVSTAETLDAVTIDAPITIAPGESYQLMVVLPDQSIATRDLTNSSGEANVLTFSSPLAEAPVAGALWIVTATNVEPRRFRVLSVVETEKHLFAISAAFHDPTKYDRIEQGLVLEAPDYTTLPVGPLPAPINPSTQEFLYLASGTTPRSGISFSWTAVADARLVGYQVQVKKPGLEWESAGQTEVPSIDIDGLVVGVHGFRVRAIGANNLVSQWLTVNEVYLSGLLAAPPSVQGFRITVVGDVATLSWSPVQTVNLSHYTIRFAPDVVGVSWSSASVLMDDITGTNVQVPAQRGTYLIKAVTQQGVASANASLIIAETLPIIVANVVEALIEDPDFPGDKTDVFAFGGALRLSSSEVMSDWTALSDVLSLSYGTMGVASEGIYVFDDIVDLGDLYTSRLSSDFRVAGADSLNVMSGWAALSSVASLSGANPEDWSFDLQVSMTDDDPGGSPVWADWQSFSIGDYTARAYRFRGVLGSEKPSITPSVTRLRVTVDMPDRVDAGDDIVVVAAGLRVDFEPPFKSLSGVSIAAQGLNTGDYYRITGKDATGFNIRFYNSADVGIERTFDYVAKGYGRNLQ